MAATSYMLEAFRIPLLMGSSPTVVVCWREMYDVMMAWDERIAQLAGFQTSMAI